MSFIVFRIPYSTNIVVYILRFCFFLLVFFFGKSIYFQKYMHISHTIPESQNAFRYIGRVKDSERNKNTLL